MFSIGNLVLYGPVVLSSPFVYDFRIFYFWLAVIQKTKAD